MKEGNVIVDPKKWDEATRGLEKSVAKYDQNITDAERVTALKEAGLEKRAASFEETAKRKPLPPPRPRQGITRPKAGGGEPITREEQVAALKGLAAEENVVGSNKWAEAAAELEQKVKPKNKPEIVQGWTAAKKALEVDEDKKAIEKAKAKIAAAQQKPKRDEHPTQIFSAEDLSEVRARAAAKNKR